MDSKERNQLALHGGPKVRTAPWPERGHVGREEKEAVDALFDESIRTGIAFGYNGPQEEAYCGEFAAWLGGGYADAVNSGSTAVHVALRSLDPEPFTEVIVSPITDPGGMMPIPLLNCIPMVADAAPGRYNTGVEQVEELISPRTSAIVVAHIGGEPADIDGIMELAGKRGIPVVEDCAQAHGARLNGNLVGTTSDVAAFSLMFGKHQCTGGQGGMVFTKDGKRSWKVRQSSDRGKPFGLPAGSTNAIAALNHNLNDLAAVIGRVQLKKLPGIVERRRAFVAEVSKGMADLETVRIPPQLPGAESSWWWWRLEANLERLSCDKDTYCRALAAEGLGINPYYRAMPHLYDWFTKRSVFGTSGLPWSSPAYKGDAKRMFPCPNALRSIERQFNLTVYESYGPKEVADMVEIFRKVDRAYRK
jgi:perosamine synthetase